MKQLEIRKMTEYLMILSNYEVFLDMELATVTMLTRSLIFQRYI